MDSPGNPLSVIYTHLPLGAAATLLAIIVFAVVQKEASLPRMDAVFRAIMGMIFPVSVGLWLTTFGLSILYWVVQSCTLLFTDGGGSLLNLGIIFHLALALGLWLAMAGAFIMYRGVRFAHHTMRGVEPSRASQRVPSQAFHGARGAATLSRG